jgi:hypothetical protein
LRRAAPRAWWLMSILQADSMGGAMAAAASWLREEKKEAGGKQAAAGLSLSLFSLSLSFSGLLAWA